MTFFQFARNNVRRNARAYSAYFLSSTFAILLFFLYATLSNHPDLHKGYVSQNVIDSMNIAQGIVYVFSFFSILYSMGSFLRGRNKEFGLLTLLGISPRQLIWLTFLENMLLGLASILVGVGVGLLLSKLFLMLGSLVLDVPSLSFYVPGQALLLTCVAFLVLFALVSVAIIFFIRNTTVLTLLTGNRRPKPEPRASVSLALLAAILLITAYVFAATYQIQHDGTHKSLLAPPLIIVLIACGTYLLYGQLSVFVLQILKKRRNYSWRGTHLLWLSELMYNMKDNARLLFVIAMLLSGVFIATDAVAVAKEEVAQDIQSGHILVSPFAFSLTEDQSRSTVIPIAKTVLNQALDDAHLPYAMIQIPFLVQKDGNNVTLDTLISESNYNHLAAAVQFPRLAVHSGEGIVFPYQLLKSYRNTYPATISLGEGKVRVKVMWPTAPGVLDSTYNASFGNPLVISNQDYHNQSVHAQQGIFVVYTMAQWKATTPMTMVLARKMQAIEARAASEGTSFSYQSRAVDYYEAYQAPNVTFFIGYFTSIVFLIASCSFLYFRLYTTLNENRKRYRALSKIGLTETEMRSSVTVQVLTLFLAPFLIAALNAAFIIKGVANNPDVVEAGTPVVLPTVETIGIFLILQVIYCLVVRTQYLSQLKRVFV